MARPKKVRVVDGVRLADNLYPDNKGRIGHYRYFRPDGSWKHFNAPTPQDANRVAEEANAIRDKMLVGSKKDLPGRDQLSYWVPLYIKHREKNDQKLIKKSSWRNRCYAMAKFGRHFNSTPVGRISREPINEWWETLTRNQQILRQAEFKRLFNWLMGQGLCPRLEYNPFTTADDRPRLYVFGQADKARMRMTKDIFWSIYNAAGEIGYECLQIAMGVSLTTFMREGDICRLKIGDNLRDDLLKKVIGKSYEKRGSAKAARLSWNQTNYELLRQLIARGQRLSLKNGRCPYLISHEPKQKRTGKTKDHNCQVTTKRLGEMFTEAREHAKIHLNPPAGRTPTTFHEIRSLSAKLAIDAGYKLAAVQASMAHEDPETTLSYQDEHDLPYQPVPVMFTKEAIGGDFA